MEIKVPEVGESVYEGLLVKWHKKDGETVHKDEPLCEIETDKITIELNAEADGILSIRAREGKTVKIGSVIGVINETPASKTEAAAAAGKDTPEPSAGAAEAAGPISPAARKMAREHALKAGEIRGTGKGGRVTVEDLFSRLKAEKGVQEPGKKRAEAAEEPGVKAARPEEVRSGAPVPDKVETEDRVTRKTMSPIRKRIAERLLAARQQTAMLTTFNEADMSRVITLRQKHREDFKKKHGVALGFMSFFVKACVEALQEYPDVNARIEGDDIVYQHFYDIGIAIGGDKGLVVPVIRDADRLHFAEIEKSIDDFVEKVKTNKLNISDLEGGTFSITNGGVYGSLLSTPMLNPPQSGILGMHAIQDRPVARDGKVVVRPMMYLAFTYDHRIIDGRQAVGFLKMIKELIEEPEEMLLEA
ncbi:MAG TPA: 2-oxoglutarate dehydrogenase complex dihydrolipoyllysine-residue succinyltransferase [Geobacteraceae bacterium]|nr:2-oxoglutarate dehydrogenase complex dihydrolipoyllysine-residue succinyltransferase [Geobacteraceae bacterium]